MDMGFSDLCNICMLLVYLVLTSKIRKCQNKQFYLESQRCLKSWWFRGSGWNVESPIASIAIWPIKSVQNYTAKWSLIMNSQKTFLFKTYFGPLIGKRRGLLTFLISAFDFSILTLHADVLHPSWLIRNPNRIFHPCQTTIWSRKTSTKKCIPGSGKGCSPHTKICAIPWPFFAKQVLLRR